MMTRTGYSEIFLWCSDHIVWLAGRVCPVKNEHSTSMWWVNGVLMRSG